MTRETAATQAGWRSAAAVPLIVLAQLFGTSLWFSANSAADDLAQAWGATTSDIGLLTNAVQVGFILGTLSFALSGFADRHPASRIFAASALVGALANGAFAVLAGGLAEGLACRFLVGLSLAGIYPLGMKLIVGWVPEKASLALAWLVGMLTLGTSLPHGIRMAGTALPWQGVILASSALALVAGATILALGDGPHLRLRAHGTGFRPGAVLAAFRVPAFRASALSYFGHQWELYAFWALVPILIRQTGLAQQFGASAAGLSFLVIGSGALGCVIGGRLSQRIGSAPVAAIALASSAACCALYPLAVGMPALLGLSLLVLWGMTAVADSPQFSAMSARACPVDLVGSALAIQNGLGFAITVISIAVVMEWVDAWGAWVAWILLPGPVLGLIALIPVLRGRAPKVR